VWDALHLYIANNLYWMKLLMEQCEQYDGRLSWEGVATLIKRAHRNEDHNITQTKIILAVYHTFLSLNHIVVYTQTKIDHIFLSALSVIIKNVNVLVFNIYQV
jgi:hypothetical protein